MTRLERSTLLLNSKVPDQMIAECWRWRPRWNRLALSTCCFGSLAYLQSLSSVLCKTAYGLESPQDRLGGTHAEGAGHPDKLTVIYSNPSDMDGSQHFFHNLLLPYHSDHVLQNYQITLFTDIDSVKLPSIVTPV